MKENKTERVELERKSPEMVNPFQMMRRFTKDMERLFEGPQGFFFPDFFRTNFPPFRTEFDQVEWVPEMEILQNNKQFTVRADLPGLRKEDVKVELTDKLLTISGERKEEKEEKQEGFYRSERTYGSFYRRIALPEGAKTENATATFHNGVLEITVPTPKAETPIRKLEIKEVTQHKAAKAASA